MPTSKKDAEQRGWHAIPQPSLLKSLEERTKHRLILADDDSASARNSHFARTGDNVNGWQFHEDPSGGLWFELTM